MAGNPYDSLMGESAPAVADANPYDALIANDQKAQLAVSAMQAEPHQPDQMAEAVTLGQSAGVPAGVAIDNLDTLRTEQRQREMDQLAERSPVLARWLTKPENMGVAKDDLGNLSAFGEAARFSKNVARSLLAGGVDLGTGVYGTAAMVAENAAPDPARNPVGYLFARLLRKAAATNAAAAQTVRGDQPGAGFIEQGIASGAQSVGQNLPFLAAGVALRNPELALYGMAGETLGQEYLNARDKSVSPMHAANYAVVQGGYEYITERIPALKLFGDLKAGTPFYKMLMNNLVREIPGEQAATLLQDFNSWVSLNPEKPLAEFVAERPGAAAQTLIATMVATGMQTGGAHAVHRTLEKLAGAHDAGATGESLTKLDAAADASKLRERSPEKFEEIAAETLKAQGRETAYMPVDQFDTYYQSQNVDPAEAWAHLTGDPSGYAQAKATGADLQIPYAKYLARLTTEERKALTPHLRMSPDEMTAAEAADFGKNRDKILGETQAAAGDTSTDPAYEHIYNDLLGQLMQRFPRDVADKYAAAEASRFIAFNKAAGTDPLADYQANAPRIVSEVPEALRRIKYDTELDPLLERLRTGNIPSASEAHGPSLLEFLRAKGLRDEQGDLGTLDPDKGLKPFERKLIRPDGMALDLAAQAARDAGYFNADNQSAPDQMDSNTLIDAIGRELHGNPVYAQNVTDPRAAKDRQVLNDLGDFLDQSGVDLATTSNEQVKQFLKDGVAPQAMLAQDQTTLDQPGYGMSRYSDGALSFLAKDYRRRANEAQDAHDRAKWAEEADAADAELARRETLEPALNQPAYHGTPHTIGPEGFKLEKIGTGEGAAAYGWGLYFAENPAVAGEYANALRASYIVPKTGSPVRVDFNRVPTTKEESAAASAMVAHRNGAFAPNDMAGGWDVAIKHAKDWNAGEDVVALLTKWKRESAAIEQRGSLYQVDIADEAVAKMLDWDRPLSEQVPEVRSALEKALRKDGWDRYIDAVLKTDAGDSGAMKAAGYNIFDYPSAAGGIYQTLATEMGQKGASLFLARAGIPGIRYRDQGSRNVRILSPKESVSGKWVVGEPQANRSDQKFFDSEKEARAYFDSVNTRNLVVFDESIVKITHKDGSPVTAAERKEYFQAAADGSSPRAQIQFSKRGAGQREFRITLKGATDLTSLLHEFGHYWLERMVDVALTPTGSQQIKDDVATLLKQYGDTTVEQWDSLPDAKRRDIHESVARANEAYLFEGKAPSAKLRAVFARFRNWMLQVYGRISKLNVNLSPEVRAVFDRLYASQQEIEQARTAQFLKPLWADRTDAGMTEAEWAAYTGASEAAKTQAEEELANAVMEPIRREEKDWWKAKRAAVTEEITAQVNRRKDIVALSVLRTGKTPDGAEVDTPKISKASLVDDFGFTPESLAKLPRGIYAVSGGQSADALAPEFGYDSGKELIEALAVVPDKKALIKESVDAELKRRYPDIIDDGSIGDKAMRAVHNDKAGELLVREAQLLAERAGTKGLRAYQLTRQMAKAAAERVIEATPAKDIVPSKWRAAEAKAGNEAYRLARAGKLDEAASAKQKQALNHFLYREAVRALETIDKRVAHMRALSTKASREAIGKAGGQEYAVRYRDGTEETFESRKAAEEAVAAKGGFWFATNTYLEQIDRILERYELRAQTNRKLSSRESLRQFVDKLTSDGIPHDIPDEVIADARQVNYRELPYGFFLAVSDAVASIENVALRKSDLIIAGQKRDRDEAAQEIAGGIRGNIKDRLPSIGDPSLPEKMADFGNDALSLYLNADYMAREMDGGKAGTVTDLIYRPIADAEVHAINRRAVAEKALADLFNEHYTPAELKALYRFTGNDAIPMPEIGETWSKSNVLALALNWGNEGNRQALLRGQYAGGRRLTQASIDRGLDTLTENDWKFVQSVWKYIDSYWPEIKAKQQQRTGVAPEKVAGLPIQTKFGQIDGGYYPLKFDGRQGGRAAVDEKADLFNDLLTGRHSAAQTKRGHTIERVGSGGRPVKIDLGVAIGHITSVVNDLELGDAVSAVYRLLEHRGVRQAFTDAGKSAYHSQLKLWVKDVARGQTAARDAASSGGRWLRTNFVKSVLTFKVATALLQQTGHVASLKIMGGKAWSNGMGQLLTRPWIGKHSVFEQIGALSPFMKSRWDSATANAGVYDVMRTAKGDSRPSWFVRSGYWAMLHSQMLVDAPTWLGAYAKAKAANPADHAAAVDAADDVVKHAQGSGLFADRAALERGTLSEDVRQSEFVKTWTTLLSYMMAKGRLAYETTRNTDFKDPLKVAQWTLSMVLLFAIESMIANIVRGGGPPDRDDDGLDLGDTLSWAGKQAGLTALGTIPLLSLLGNELQGFRGSLSVTEALHRVGTLENQVEQGEWDKALVRSLSDTLGILTGFPSGQADIAIDAFWRAKEGEDVSPIEYLMRVQHN
jgi:hypothetical protein